MFELRSYREFRVCVIVGPLSARQSLVWTNPNVVILGLKRRLWSSLVNITEKYDVIKRLMSQGFCLFVCISSLYWLVVGSMASGRLSTTKRQTPNRLESISSNGCSCIISGQGWDRHLFAMKYYAEKNKGDVLDFFKDPNYVRINRIILSTSTVTSPALQIGGFGPVIPEGYGVGTCAHIY